MLGVKITGINPATGETLKSFEEMSGAEVGTILTQTAQAFQEWKNVDFPRRAHAMKSVAPKLRARQNEFAELMAREMGKPVSQGRAEVEKCAWACDFYAEQGESFL